MSLSKQEIIRIDKIKWWIVTDANGKRTITPLCPQHNLRMTCIISNAFGYPSDSTQLECAEGPHRIVIPRKFSNEQQYVINRIDALAFANMKVLNLDDEAIPVAIDQIKNDSPFWVLAKVTESKSGLRLVIWAGDRSKKTKTQLFVEPELQRMSFDQNDDHPTKIFVKVEAKFINKIVTKIKKEN